MNTKIRFQHFHEGNDPDHVVRGTALYATSAALVDLDTGVILEQEWAYCNPADVPSRELGRKIALGKLKGVLIRSDIYDLLSQEEKEAYGIADVFKKKAGFGGGLSVLNMFI